MQGFIKPQLATLKSKAPKGDQWLHGINDQVDPKEHPLDRTNLGGIRKN